MENPHCGRIFKINLPPFYQKLTLIAPVVPPSWRVVEQSLWKSSKIGWENPKHMGEIGYSKIIQNPMELLWCVPHLWTTHFWNHRRALEVPMAFVPSPAESILDTPQSSKLISIYFHQNGPKWPSCVKLIKNSKMNPSICIPSIICRALWSMIEVS